MMMKKLVLLFLFAIGSIAVFSQESHVFANSDKAFYDGKELFLQQKYAASLSSFEQYLKNHKLVTGNENKVQEAEYYIACNAFELHKEIAPALLEAYLNEYPATQFADRVTYMLGTISYETRRYNKAIQWFEKTNEKNLTKVEQADLLFKKGYVYIETMKWKEAKTCFKDLKGKKSKYDVSARYYYAYASYMQKDYSDALEDFLGIVDAAEYKAFVPYYIVQIYFIQKEYDKLKPHALELLATQPENPNNVELYRILGECAYSVADYKEAMMYLKKYAIGNPQLVRNDMYMLGIACYKSDEFKDATNYLSKVTTKKDSLAQNAYLHLGYAYVKTGLKNNARMAYRSAAEMDFDPKIQEEAAYNYTLSTFETTTPFSESIVAFENFIQKYPSSKYIDDINQRLVTVYMSTKNYAAANESLARLKTLNPEMQNVKAYLLFQMGTEHFVKEEYDKAIEIFTKSIQTGNSKFNAAQVYYWRGETYYRQGKYDEAREDMTAFGAKKGAKDFPNASMVHYVIAYTFFQQKNFSEAKPFFQKYLTKESNKTGVYYADALDRLGDCEFYAKNLAAAEKYYADAFAIGGSNSDYSLFQKAFVQGLQKNYQGKVLGLQRLLKEYPKSRYADNAFFELGRAYVSMGQNDKAIAVYNELVATYPMQSTAKKAALQIAFLYMNSGQDIEAIDALRKVIAAYPNSEETRTALESLESIYVGQNNVEEYFAYTKTLAPGIVSIDPTREDSLTYIAAKTIYERSNFEKAAISFEKYINQFCEGGMKCGEASFFLADCYYQLNKKEEALVAYSAISNLPGSMYLETSLVRMSELLYDKMDYENALPSFKRILEVAEEKENISAAKIGILRCSYLLNDLETLIQIAEDILKDKTIDKDLERESRFYLAKAYVKKGESDKALPSLKLLSANLLTAVGAESKYMLANYYFETGSDKKAELEVNDFIKKGTPYQYWLARSFVLLADVYIKRNEDFQAKQYLLSLQANYKTQDSIQDLILQRLDEIAQREQNTIVE